MDLPERQRACGAYSTIPGGYSANDEQEIMARIIRFSGWFHREAAQEVAGASLNDLMRLTR